MVARLTETQLLVERFAARNEALAEEARHPYPNPFQNPYSSSLSDFYPCCYRICPDRCLLLAPKHRSASYCFILLDMRACASRTRAACRKF